VVDLPGSDVARRLDVIRSGSGTPIDVVVAQQQAGMLNRILGAVNPGVLASSSFASASASTSRPRATSRLASLGGRVTS